MLTIWRWPLIGNLVLCLFCHHLTNSHRVSTLQVNNKNNISKPSSGANSNDSSGLDEILRDTMQLLDSLDQRLDVVKNKTIDKRLERQENFRMLDGSVVPVNGSKQQPNGGATGNNRNLEEDRRLTSLAEGFSSERQRAASTRDEAARGELDPLVGASSDSTQAQPQPQVSSNKKAARQLVSLDTDPSLATQQSSAALGRFTDNDFSEKHIRFSLDLMRAVFSSQQYTSKSNSIDSFLISPVSIQMVLMMMHLGARGQTKRELANCLHLVTPTKLNQASAASTSSSAFLSSGNSTATNSKLSRRHQQQQQPPVAPVPAAAPSASNTHKQSTSHHHQQQQQHQAGSFRQQATQQTSNNNNNLLHQIQQAQSNNVHEQFGSAMRQLLKDQTVVKALSSANQIFVQRDLPLLAQYEWAVKNYYGTDLKLVDFQNQNLDQQQQNRSITNSTSSSNNNNIQLMVNDWIERQTKGKISNFLPAPVPSSTLLMALNVLFFKGDWQYKFDPADTDPEAWFSLTNGRTIKVPMMVNKLPLAHAHDPTMKASLIELPYKAQRLGLFILLPDEVNGIFETMQLLNQTSFANLVSMMRKPSSTGPNAEGGGGGINVRIPKFTIESSPRMSHILSQQLGLKTLFTPDLADLSGMFNSKRSKQPGGNQTSQGSTGSDSDNQPAPIQVGLDELHHKAVLQVHEQGSVAAAASATIVERVGLFNGQYFEADHPFLLFLMDKQTGLVLFSGVFAGPPGSGQDNSVGLPSDSTNHGSTNATSSPEGGSNHLAGRSLKQAGNTNAGSSQ